MSNCIRLLPDILANKIAAGEVVQRPASVVKELLENAIDANTTTIKVLIKDAGKTLIQVIDNGIGMSEKDARMSFERHATSKISVAEDLFNIQTMGFRGEALASIAAVAQIELETCRKEDVVGTRIVIEGSQVKTQAQVAAPKGTKISVKHLFFNVPARRNFLKSHAVETKHIIEEFQRAALSQPEIAFSLYQNNIETYQLPPAKLSHRIVHLFGENYKQQLIPCQETTDLLKVKGYIGKPEYAKKTRGEQFFFVNQRFIKSPYLHHAIKHTLEGLLPATKFPFYVIFIDVPPAHIDVNVHPTKTEIKFTDERMVYSILTAAIKQALATHHVVPSIDFEQHANFNPFAIKSSSKAASTSKLEEKNYAQFRHTDALLQQESVKKWEQLFHNPEEEEATQGTSGTTTIVKISQATPHARDNQDTTARTTVTSSIKIQLHKQYILTQLKSGILLIDQQAAHERILYERYVQPQQHSAPTSTQQLLFPVRITLNPADLVLVQEQTSNMHALGFALTSFGKNSLIVTGCPVEVANHDLKQLLEEVIEQFKKNQAQLSLPIKEIWARSLAQRASIQPGKVLQQPEIDSLVDQLFACTHPDRTPDGRKTLVSMTLEEIQSLFRR